MPQPHEIAARILDWEDNGPQGPMTLELYPTLACNLDCTFCDTTDRHRPPVNELSTTRLLEIIDEAAKLGVQRLFLLGGGEPLTRKNATPAVMVRAKEHNMEGILTTNGTLLNGQIADTLLDIAWDEVHFSIDGPNPEIHDDLRGKRGAFKKTVQNACRLSVRKNQRGLTHPRIALHFVLTNKNHKTLTEMVNLAHAIGAFRIDFDALIAYTPEQQSLSLSADQREEVPEIAFQAMHRAKELGIETTLENFLSPEKLNRGHTELESPEGEGFKAAPCLKAWHYLVVQADGKSSPCCVLAGQGGSAAEQSIEQLWLHDPFMERVRTGMLRGTPLNRCKECSWNILQHEALIRSHL
mgnify:CR=1 FL=1